MKKYLVSINDLPPDGKEFEIDDQNVWLEPLREFKMDCRIEQPLKARFFVKGAEDGCLVRGSLVGGVVMPCNRCTEDAHIQLDSHFDEYEEIEAAGQQHHGADASDSHIVFERNAPMLDLGEVAWEQFMLALPPRPLCKPDCKGLCQRCGANLNLDACSCQKEEGDPRLAALRDFVIPKQ